MIIIDFIGAILALAFWIVVVYAAVRIAGKCIRTANEVQAGREALGHRARRS